MKSPITTHILDTSTGTPAANVAVCLELLAGEMWQLIDRKETDFDGRITSFKLDQPWVKGTYRLVFKTQDYFATTNRSAFFPRVTIEFEVSNLQQHYHVPLLLSPYGYSTYRGS